MDNCQVGVFASLCQNGMASLIDARLYLPEHWVSDTDRCDKVAIPEECQHYQSKYMLPRRQLTAEELAEIIHKRHQRRLSAKQSSTRRKWLWSNLTK
ncbi:MAG: transposase [Nitrosomonas sp.]|nr:transposase [Nitrosomonas sp.]